MMRWSYRTLSWIIVLFSYHNIQYCCGRRFYSELHRADVHHHDVKDRIQRYSEDADTAAKLAKTSNSIVKDAASRARSARSKRTFVDKTNREINTQNRAKKALEAAGMNVLKVEERSRAAVARRRSAELASLRAKSFAKVHTGHSMSDQKSRKNTRQNSHSEWNDKVDEHGVWTVGERVNSHGEWEVKERVRSGILDSKVESQNNEIVMMRTRPNRIPSKSDIVPESVDLPLKTGQAENKDVKIEVEISVKDKIEAAENTNDTKEVIAKHDEISGRNEERKLSTMEDKKLIKYRNISAVVTGASGSIGTQICIGLILSGITVVPVCHTAPKCKYLQTAIMNIVHGYIIEDHNNHKIEIDKLVPATLDKMFIQNIPLEVDVRSAHSVQAFITAVKGIFPSGVGILINNAAVVFKEKTYFQMVESNSNTNKIKRIENQFATNVMGYYHFMVEMFALLSLWSKGETFGKPNGRARIVNMSSTFAGYLNISDLQFDNRVYTAGGAYQQSKQANRMLSWIAARDFYESGITVHACHPGLASSNLSASLGFGDNDPNSAFALAQAKTAAEVPLFLAISQDADVQNPGARGGWWERSDGSNGRPAKNIDCMYSEPDQLRIAQNLWEKCSEFRTLELSATLLKLGDNSEKSHEDL